MDTLEQRFKKVTLASTSNCFENEAISKGLENLRQIQLISCKRGAPTIPPKPQKNLNKLPQVPSSSEVTISREPSYSQPLMGVEKNICSMSPGNSSNLQRENFENPNKSQTTLDNPAILEQQLEALAYRKLKMEKNGLLGLQIQSSQKSKTIPKLSSSSLRNSTIYSNTNLEKFKNVKKNVEPYSCKSITTEYNTRQFYLNISTSGYNNEEDLPPPPSPVSAVSSSYSELRRASNTLIKPKNSLQDKDNTTNLQKASYYSYDSTYEPINPRMSTDAISQESFSFYVPYATNTVLNVPNGVGETALLYTQGSGLTNDYEESSVYRQKFDGAPNILSTIDVTNELENYGICVKCNSRVLGETSGCTAMSQIFHVTCFTCTECQINLQGKPFYALDGKPYCEYDYLQTLEKCSVCMKPILERILRATGKPYHPQCFTCIICGKSLDGLLFTVDATNQNYCITDFHKKFAPRCCVCKHPIMPESGQEETVRVVALDRSFHLGCYKCEDCGLLLSSEAEGRGCYPLDDHILCKSCNAQRVQVLTKRMT
ncbi:zyxin isoform X1 [Drosophila ananassae]|uniref:zyxin isoform X1 n=1 Tax=Drosophila ananassae TaxID=7217 RepID=UPI0013A5E3F3|nr:zyxin isoform X1 [Drosophila ananassae]